MLNHKCRNCGAETDQDREYCPRCQMGYLEAHSHDISGDDHMVQSVSAPIARKRSLPYSCLVGFLLFLPTGIFVFILMHYYYTHQQTLEEQERMLSAEQPEVPGGLQLGIDRVANMRRITVDPDEMIAEISVKGSTLLVVSVNGNWSKVPHASRLEQTKRWFSLWQSLGGEDMKVFDAQLETPVAIINAATSSVDIPKDPSAVK